MKVMTKFGHMSEVALDTTLQMNDKKIVHISFTPWNTPSLNISFNVKLLALLQHQM